MYYVLHWPSDNDNDQTQDCIQSSTLLFTLCTKEVVITFISDGPSKQGLYLSCEPSLCLATRPLVDTIYIS